MSIAGKKIGVALFGGGYRAAAYHIGTLRALHRLGLLDKVDVLSSVSGGSITAAYYALHKDSYEDFERSFIKGLSRGVLWPSFLYLGGVGLVLLALSVALGYLAAFLAGAFRLADRAPATPLHAPAADPARRAVLSPRRLPRP